MSYLKIEHKLIRKQSEVIPPSKWILDERGRLVGFDQDINEAIHQAKQVMSDSFDRMCMDILTGKFGNNGV